MKKFMHFLAKLFPNSSKNENSFAVKMFYFLSKLKEVKSNLFKQNNQHWPVASGNYEIVNPQGQIAVCTLTSENYFSLKNSSENIAIIGTVFTPNLGIEKIIQNIISNPNIRHLVLCGKDSPIFRAGQAIECLFNHGITSEKRIINATGHFPVLKNISSDKIEHFLAQVQLINFSQNNEFEVIKNKINTINVTKNPFSKKIIIPNEMNENEFILLKPFGKRTPLDYDKNGFFVITAEPLNKQIIVKHYYTNNKPGFIIKGKSAESILLAILKENLVSEMSHAGYLGSELTKAETALKLNLTYIQDKSLKNNLNSY